MADDARMHVNEESVLNLPVEWIGVITFLWAIVGDRRNAPSGGKNACAVMDD